MFNKLNLFEEIAIGLWKFDGTKREFDINSAWPRVCSAQTDLIWRLDIANKHLAPEYLW